VTLTIVCVCGTHNAVSDADLESAVCHACGQPLLRPAHAPGHSPTLAQGH